MSRKRLSAADRRAEILAAARRAFAKYGLKASSLQIAAEAGVSDALIFRHFATKEALHRAVLRDLIQDQNTAYANVGPVGYGAEGLVKMLVRYFQSSLENHDSEHAERVRILSGNLANGGDYARLAYRRAVRRGHKPVAQLMDEATAAGDLSGRRIAPENFIMYLEHIGSMVLLASATDAGAGSYAGDKNEQLRQLVWFAARGIGLSDASINRYYDK